MITAEQLLEVFAAYNPQIWPMQIVAYILGIAVLIMAAFKFNISRRGIPAVLAFFWLWVALFSGCRACCKDMRRATSSRRSS
jgi:hypothetical protein